MTTFQALMALSATQTKQSQSAVQSALVQRQRKEEQKRKQQEEQDKRQLEMEKKLRLKHFENERREQERIKRMEQVEEAKRAALQRREDEQRDALRYGPKKAKAVASASVSEGSSPKWPSSSSQSRVREEVRKRRLPDNDDDDSAPEFLTREEKREKKQQLEMRKLFNTSKRSSNAGSYSKPGRRLPGGAVDVTTTPQSMDSSAGSKSVKERITAMPNTLTKLNTVKRDTRTIDEILQDRAKLREVKVLDGDEAREFNDWFGSSKKKEAAKKSPTQLAASTVTSGANTPASQGSNTSSTPQASGSGLMKKATAPTPAKLSLTKAASSRATGTTASKSANPSSRPSTSDKHISSKSQNASGKPSKSSTTSTNSRSSISSAPAKKRPRSISRSESPPYKRRAVSPEYNSLGDTIWKMFGRERNNYVGMDVLSDDEDMEADATVLEKEEKFSARIAKKEDVLALEEERSREEEKRRRKKEKEARERRN